MSTENQNRSADESEIVSNDKVQDQVAYDTYSRVLGEKKRTASENADLKAQLDAYKQNELEAKGQHTEVITSLRQQLSEEKAARTKSEKTFAWNSVVGQIKSEAVKQGCINGDKFVKLLGQDQLAGIEVGDDYKVNSEDMARIIADGIKENSDIGLFTKKTVNINNVNATGVSKSAPKTMDQMTVAEIEAELLKG
jgi:hypothetical protein